MLLKEDIVTVVSSLTLVVSGAKPLPRLEKAGAAEASLTEDDMRVPGLVSPSRTAAQSPVLTLRQPAFRLFL